ncbi:MAG: GIY-YIG nuclease family protein [Flavobacteriaceae bacterium]|nr:GIY-YIG nuclease family protein [Flavobacteriaceae bacterium]
MGPQLKAALGLLFYIKPKSMPFCYIIYSSKLDKYYTGSCANFDLRLKAHNSKKYAASFTSKSDDWKRFIVIQTQTNKHAIRLERKIKQMKSRVFIENLKKYPELLNKIKQQTNI